MWVWILFIVFVIGCLAIDLWVLNKEDHKISTAEAGKWVVLWVSLALAFSGMIYWLFSADLVANPDQLTAQNAFLDYLTGYLVELSLSMDNLFVIAVIFSAFEIPAKYQHRVLFWGILGALVFRALMIFFGVALLHKFDWIIYVFGVFLLYTAFAMLKDDEKMDPKNSWVYRGITKLMPITDEIHGHDFFTKKNNKTYATPLFVALIVVELTDVMFALDSVPAILAITQNEFIAFSSNILAILGLRSLFFLIVGVLEKFRFINYSLAVILAFVGLKMLLENHIHIPSWISLVFILVVLSGGILASLYIKPKA